MLKHNLTLGYMAGWGVAEPVENFGGSLLPEATTYACNCPQTTLLAEAIIQYASPKIVAADSNVTLNSRIRQMRPTKIPKGDPKVKLCLNRSAEGTGPKSTPIFPTNETGVVSLVRLNPGNSRKLIGRQNR